ncbi:MAG: SCO family protein [Gammaproteobacteria bacterium]|nr:SCO family protein [Gammaproteobacteria bacterium]
MALRSKLIIGVAATVAMSAGFWLSSMQQSNNDKKAHEEALAEARSNYSPIQGTILSPARKIAVPALIKDDGATFTLNDLTGHWSLLFFGYTHCPDVCPVTMGAVAQAKKLADTNDQMFPDVVFVSVDPERDKVEMLGEYVQYFDKAFIGVTGDKNLIKALTLQMSVVYMKMSAGGNSETDSSGYLVDHSSALLLLNPEGKLVAFMNPPHDPETILKDLQTVVNQNN